MKTCPKCNTEHNRPGTFCSRSCANSRTFSKESKELKRIKSKVWWDSLSENEKERRIANIDKPENRRKGTQAFIEVCKLSQLPIEAKNQDPSLKTGKWAKTYTPVKKCRCCIRLIHYKKLYCDSCYPNIRLYRKRCKFDFNVYNYPQYFNLNLLENNGWYKPGINPLGVSRDHLFTIADGFKNKVNPDIMKHPANCQLLLHADNNRKNMKSSITLEELLERIEHWNTNI